MSICKPSLEKSSKNSNKIMHYLQGLNIKAISENIAKYDSNSKKDTYREVPLELIWML